MFIYGVQMAHLLHHLFRVRDFIQWNNTEELIIRIASRTFYSLKLDKSNRYICAAPSLLLRMIKWNWSTRPLEVNLITYDILMIMISGVNPNLSRSIIIMKWLGLQTNDMDNRPVWTRGEKPWNDVWCW